MVPSLFRFNQGVSTFSKARELDEENLEP
uniref:Uncharacterized protein n=1 Tax=Rhizophora mucronata TaxID=61149 RepID=A0A2P2IYP6_RHIMU